MTGLLLDRMALDDVGANPARLAKAIHEQLDDPPGAVPVHDIALALDIYDVREEWLTNLEGALITGPERDKGAILVNRASIPQRRRFTLAHELGHFLNPWHKPTNAEGFQCTRLDMATGDLRSLDNHRRQEAEANSFAIELLTPRKHLLPHLSGDADLSAVVAIAAAFDISREAAARRYVSLHQDTTAVVFSRNGVFSYAVLSPEFPGLCLRRGMALPIITAEPSEAGLSEYEDATPADWIRPVQKRELTIQQLRHREGSAITLLRVLSAEDDEEDFEDLANRFTSWYGAS